MARTDRAVCENDTEGLIKPRHEENGAILGATIVAGRAGKATELILAIKQGMKITDFAGAIHAYPTHSMPIQQMAADIAVDDMLSSVSGKLILGLSKFVCQSHELTLVKKHLVTWRPFGSKKVRLMAIAVDAAGNSFQCSDDPPHVVHMNVEV
jgi:pyridine nucleotide-disulfide oxidoreductase